MTFPIKTYSFDECYLSINQFLTIDEDTDQIFAASPEAIPFPVTDGNILDAVLRYYLTHHKAKTTYNVAHSLKVNTRDLSSAIHLLTGMSHEDFLRQYRLRAIVELLTLTALSTLTIARFFGYASLASFNQFVSDQTDLTPNEIRAGKNPKEKQKRLAWWQKGLIDLKKNCETAN